MKYLIKFILKFFILFIVFIFISCFLLFSTQYGHDFRLTIAESILTS